MGNVVAIKSMSEAAKVLDQNHELVDQNDIRQTVQNALSKLNEVEERIDKIESKGFFKRMIGSVTGSNQKEMVSTMRDLSKAQNMTIQLVLSLAIMHSENQRTLEIILNELNQSKGTYSRITDHIEFLYNHVDQVKESQRSASLNYSNSKKTFNKVIVFIGITGVLFIIGMFIITII